MDNTNKYNFLTVKLTEHKPPEFKEKKRSRLYSIR